MAYAEIERLKTDLATDTALQAKLATAFGADTDAAAAAEAFQAAGYRIEASDLLQKAGLAPLSDEELVHVSAGNGERRMENGQIVGGARDVMTVLREIAWGPFGRGLF